MAIEHRIKPKYKSRNHQLVAELRASAGAGPPVDPYIVVKKNAAALSAAMAILHGGDWRVEIDHQTLFVLIAPRLRDE